MSGTSFDGVDAALIKTDGKDHIEFKFRIFTFSKKEKTLYRSSILKILIF